MELKELMEKLNENGYFAEMMSVTKNGVEKTGLLVKRDADEDVGAIYYGVSIDD